ncbi:MAG: hypothetical protein ACYCSO_07745 [Cuniculiplasma sp.]
MVHRESLVYDLDKKIGDRNFPGSYVDKNQETLELEIMPGKDLFMYRKDESINLVIDGKSFPFDDPYIAKFYYFCSLLNKTKVNVPNKENTRKIIKKFERDLDEDRNKAMDVLNPLPLGDQIEIMKELAMKKKYFFLLFYDQLPE